MSNIRPNVGLPASSGIPSASGKQDGGGNGDGGMFFGKQGDEQAAQTPPADNHLNPNAGLDAIPYATPPVSPNKINIARLMESAAQAAYKGLHEKIQQQPSDSDA